MSDALKEESSEMLSLCFQKSLETIESIGINKMVTLIFHLLYKLSQLYLTNTKGDGEQILNKILKNQNKATNFGSYSVTFFPIE